MTIPVGGIDPHQDTFTVGIVDAHGIETCHETFENTAAGYLDAIDLLNARGVRQVGVEGSAKWGAHVAIALAAAGFDAREVPASRSAAQRRSRRLDKTDAADAGTRPCAGGLRPAGCQDRSGARAPPSPGRGPHTGLHHVGDQIAKLPTEIRDQLTSTGKVESRLRRLEHIAPASAPPWPARTASNDSRRSSNKTAQRAARPAGLSASSTSCSTNTAPPCATKPASARSQPRPCCTRSEIPAASTENPSSPAGAAPAPSRCPQAKALATRSSTASTSAATGASTACSTSPRSPNNAASPKRPPTSPAKPPKARPDAKPDEPTNDTSPTASSTACGETKPLDDHPSRSPLDKGASDRPSHGDHLRRSSNRLGQSRHGSVLFGPHSLLPLSSA